MDCSTTHPSGTMSGRSTADRGVDWWISSLRGFRASLTPSPDDELVRLTTAISGRTPSEWFLRLDPDTSSWRTPGFNFATEGRQHTLTPSLLSLPASGTTRNGRLYQLQPLVPRTSVRGGGVLPTPLAADAERTSTTFRRGNPTLRGFALVPMPTVNGNNNRKGVSAKSGDGLATWVRRYPTPKARDARNGGAPAELRRKSPDLNTVAKMYPTLVIAQYVHNRSPSPGAQTRLSLTGMAKMGLWPVSDVTPQLRQEMVGGLLNPRWVEWLMGIPVGWTSLEPLAMESFRQWSRSF